MGRLAYDVALCTRARPGMTGEPVKHGLTVRAPGRLPPRLGAHALADVPLPEKVALDRLDDRRTEGARVGRLGTADLLRPPLNRLISHGWIVARLADGGPGASQTPGRRDPDPAQGRSAECAIATSRSPGDALSDGGVDYVIERVEPAPNPMSFWHAWAMRADQR